MKKYIVRDGETMWNVSKATGVRLNLLMAANPQVHDPNHLQPGSVLSIPELGKESAKSTSAPEQTGTGAGPQSGGFHAHGTMKGPQSGGASPSPGQSPPQTASTVPYFGFVWPHVVQPGESWDTVAGMYNVPVDSLRRMNPRQASSLQPGDVVYVPGSAGQVPGTVPAAQPRPNGSQGGSQVPWGWPWPMPSYTGGGAGTMPQMPGYPGGAGTMPQMPGYPGGAGTMPQMPGYPGGTGAMPQMPGYPGGTGAMPQMPGYPGGAGAMPQMPGYPGGTGAMPQMPPGYPGGTGAMPQMPGYGAQWPTPPTYPQGDGPNTHNPIRNTWYDNMALPPYPAYVPAVPNTRGDYGVPMRNLDGKDWNGTEVPDSEWQNSASSWRADRESDATLVYREGAADEDRDRTNEVPRRPSETWHWPDVASENGPSSSKDRPDAEG